MINVNSPISVFSPKQIYVGTALGGPFAGIYYLWANFRALAKPKAAIASIVGGLVLIPCLFIIPETVPDPVVPLLYGAIAAGVAWHYQVSSEEGDASDNYVWQSNWQVAKAAIVGLLLIVIVVSVLIALNGISS